MYVSADVAVSMSLQVIDGGEDADERRQASQGASQTLMDLGMTAEARKLQAAAR
jgi:hypothetical protein